MPLSRRKFFTLLTASGLASASMGSAIGRALGQQPRMTAPRAISYNVHAFTCWPPDRPKAKEAVRKGQVPIRMALELALYDPDIINFSESPPEPLVQEVAEHLGMHQVRLPSGGNWPGTILSRYEIVDSANVPLAEGRRPAELFTRHWGRATLKMPDDEELIVHSLHLMPGRDPAIRLRETAEILRNMAADMQANRSMLVLGDLNHTPEAEEYRMWLEAGWIDTFTAAGTGEGPTFPADMPTRRIDYILARGPIAERLIESRRLYEGAFRLDTRDPHGFALSDHLPQLAVFSGWK